MALNGSLADLTVLEVLRMPVPGRKTGELLIASPDNDARLYYVDGSLVHLDMGDFEGQEALAEIIGWSEGMFEFRLDVVSDCSTFKTGFQTAIRLALRLRRERMGVSPTSTENPENIATIRTLLETSVAHHDFLLHAGIIRRDGTLVCAVDGGLREPEAIDEQRHAICQLALTYPRKALNRILLSEERGTLAGSLLDDGTILMILSDRSARVGAVSLCLDRLVGEISSRLVN